MSAQDRWTLIQETMLAFSPHYQNAVQVLFGEDGFQGGDWFICFLAYGIDPEPITAAFIHEHLNPYTHPSAMQNLIDGAAEREFIQGDAETGYTLTRDGRDGIVRFFGNAWAALAQIEPLPAAEMAQAADLLRRVVEATAAASDPTAKPYFQISRRTSPDGDKAPAIHIDQFLTDLTRYRDDAHIAAWRDFHVSGHAWEAFTAIWREEATTPAALVERFANRNYDEDAYAAALADLAQRGWVEETDDGYRLTEHGRSLREEAEATTDRYFYTGWSALDDAETAALDDLLTRLRAQLRAQAADHVITTVGDTYDVMGSISGSLYKLTRDAVNPALEKADLAAPGLAFGLVQAASFDPQPISAELMLKRSPYTAAASWEKRLAALAEKGMLSPLRDGSYELTDNGRSAFNRFLAAFRGKLDQLAEQIEVDLDRLATLLGRVVNASLQAPTPPGAWALGASHSLYPGDDAPALARVDQYLDDLNAFRDDAHLASFAAHDVDGHAWELFTQLWRDDDVKDAATMAEKMGFRGYDEAAYAAALDDLAARGWVQAGDDGYTLTAQGTAVRETAETDTNRYFYLPWANLSQADRDELGELLGQLDAELKKMTTAIPA